MPDDPKPADPAPAAWGPRVTALENAVKTMAADVEDLKKLAGQIREFVAKPPAPPPAPPGAPPAKTGKRWS